MATTSRTEGDGRGTPTAPETEDEHHFADAQRTAFTPTLSGPEWREMHVLLELTYKNQAEAATSPT